MAQNASNKLDITENQWIRKKIDTPETEGLGADQTSKIIIKVVSLEK